MTIHRNVAPSGTTPPSMDSLPNKESTASLLKSSEPLRCSLIACLAILTGWILLYLLLPPLSGGSVEILQKHLPVASTTPMLFWLRLSWSRLPFWFLLAMAGFTRFSGGLSTAVLGYRGLCDGVAMGFLWQICMGHVTAELPTGLSPLRLCAAYGIWIFCDLLIRLTLTLGARRMARDACTWTSTVEGRMPSRARERLWRYVALCLGTLGATLAACGVYTAILFV